MKEMSLLTYITQLGLSVAVPLGGFVLLAVWLRNSLSLGVWVIWAGLILGLLSAVSGFLSTLRAMRRLVKDPRQQDPPIAFNDHD